MLGPMKCSSLALALAATVVPACKDEPTRAEVVAKHRPAVEARLEAVEKVGAALAKGDPAPAGGYRSAEAPIWVQYPTPSEPANPDANAFLAYEHDLLDLSKPGDVDDRLRIPYSELLSQCAESLAGGSQLHPTYLDVILTDCAKIDYLFAIRIKDMVKPVANLDEKTFTPGYLDTEILVFDLDAPDVPVGGFPLRVESGQTAGKQYDRQGPAGDLMSRFANQVRQEAEARRNP